MPRNWWHRLVHGKKKQSRRGTPACKRPPQLETLEERLAPAHLSYQGGPVLANVAVTTVYYGDWSTIPKATTDHLNNFFKTITNSAYMDLLGQYSVTKKTPGYAGTAYNIGGGSFQGSQFVAASLGSTVEDHNQRAMGVDDPTNIQDMPAVRLRVEGVAGNAE